LVTNKKSLEAYNRFLLLIVAENEYAELSPVCEAGRFGLVKAQYG